jgi:hypothetical protein
MAFATPQPITPVPHKQQQMFQEPLSDSMIESVGEPTGLPTRVCLVPLAHNDGTDHSDIAFLDELCQETCSLMRIPSSYLKVRADRYRP